MVSHSCGKSHTTNEETSRGQTTFARTENGIVKMTEGKKISIPTGESDESITLATQLQPNSQLYLTSCFRIHIFHKPIHLLQ